MLSTIKMAIFLWPLLLFTPSVISRSFVTKATDEKFIWKRDVDAVETNSTKPNIYSFTVTSNITYRYAVTTVSNRVVNPANTSKEIKFHVTLPDSAFISKFLMVIKDKAYEAYVKEKEEAKKDYDIAVEHGYTAGLVSLSARDSNVFTVNVNTEANGKVTFNLTYEQLLTRTLGQYENVINVNPGQIVKSFNIDVNIEESSNITSLQVSDLKTDNEIDSNNTKSIDAKVEKPTGNTVKISWSPDQKQQKELSENGVQGQFIVRYDVDHSSHPNQILVDEGYFVHFYAPTDLKTLPKHVLFVLDISGSMAGHKIEQLREALTLILSDIGEGDFFSILLFSDSVQLWTLNGTSGEASPTWPYDEVRTTPSPELEVNERFIIPATLANIKNATEFAKSLQETGGTNIIAAIRKALQIAQWGQKQHGIKAKPLIIFLTDGQPNVEMSDPDEIIKTVKKLNPDKYPVFSLAFGQGADYDFLRKLSLSNGGFARNIYVAADTTLQLNNFYKEVASPLLSNVTFEYIPGQIEEGFVTKKVFNNLYNGSELVVAGKLSNNTKELGGNLTYEAIDGFFCVPLPSPYVPAQKSQGHLEKLWAFLYIKELLDKDLISDEKNSTFKQKALKLSLEYGFVTPLTSLVVVKPNETDSGASIRNSDSQNNERISQTSIAAIGLKGPSNIQYSPGAGTSLFSANHAQPMSMMQMKLPRRQSLNYLMAPMPPQMGFKKHGYFPSRIVGGPLRPAASTSSNVFTTTAPAPTESSQYEDMFQITETIDGNVTEFSTPAYNLSDIVWLQNKTEIKFPSSNNSYSVFVGDLPNIEYQSCMVPNSNNTLRHCRHLVHCIVPEILSTFEDFIPYGEQCVIDARFVGICCPKQFVSQKLESTTGTAIATTPTTTLLSITTTA